MTFLELPKDWRRQPLSDSAFAADVVDLYCSAGDRRRGTLMVLICDEKDCYRGAIAIDLSELSDDHPPTNFTSALKPVIRPLTVYPEGSLILALARPGPPDLTDTDFEWLEAATHVCRVVGVRLLGFYLASPDAVTRAEFPVAA
ncbi:hypothetical protein EV643_107265 [Kribbella sp. VKM Ac-2527]|uniref:Uncharacterized protein n=1 Tax=Kribbella caucasensis TaxID=2512215 RepID=A0A4R6KF14_9ACTN|nr:hypothetical protein [Kribbella sp. VKM Ac-2527]TDO48635.1 hypothetical protein EV643_107265 [Kribbella sp. VKM Ac-2527]